MTEFHISKAQLVRPLWVQYRKKEHAVILVLDSLDPYKLWVKQPSTTSYFHIPFCIVIPMQAVFIWDKEERNQTKNQCFMVSQCCRSSLEIALWSFTVSLISSWSISKVKPSKLSFQYLWNFRNFRLTESKIFSDWTKWCPAIPNIRLKWI